MKARITNGNRGIELTFEGSTQSYCPPNGEVLIEFEGKVGKLWIMKDSIGHRGGNGVGEMYGQTAIMVTKEMEVIILPKTYDTFPLTVLVKTNDF